MPRTTTPANASTGIKGIIEIATDTEAKALSSQTLATTPGNLAAVFAEPPALGSTTPNEVKATSVKTQLGTAAAPAHSFSSETTTGFFLTSLGGDIAVTLRAAVFMDIVASGYVRVSGLMIGSYNSNQRDVILARDAANTLAQRNGANAQTYRLYGTYTDGSNYEWLTL